MSSIDSIQTSVPNDPGLQLAPVGDEGPNFNLLKKAFEDCVRDNQPTRVPGEMGRRDMVIVEAIYASAAQGGKRIEVKS